MEEIHHAKAQKGRIIMFHVFNMLLVATAFFVFEVQHRHPVPRFADGILCVVSLLFDV